jgi:FkbM family methyltransferase
MHVNRVALSDYDGETTFNVQKIHSPRIPLSSSMRQDMGEAEREIVVVPTLKLDSYIKNNNIDSIDLIKIDTEGTEDKVLE